MSPAFEGQGGGKCGQSTWLASALFTGGLLWRAGQDIRWHRPLQSHVVRVILIASWLTSQQSTGRCW